MESIVNICSDRCFLRFWGKSEKWKKFMEKVFKSYILDSGRDICIGNKSLIAKLNPYFDN